MIAIIGITGRVGGQLAMRLLADGVAVRAVVRDSSKGEARRNKGCEGAVAELTDVRALTSAFKGAEAVFVLPPPDRTVWLWNRLDIFVRKRARNPDWLHERKLRHPERH